MCSEQQLYVFKVAMKTIAINLLLDVYCIYVVELNVDFNQRLSRSSDCFQGITV